jgi:hypothetical protein
MQRRDVLIMMAAVAGLAASGGASPGQSTAAATQPASTTRPALPALDPAVEKVLDRLEKKGEALKDIEANVDYEKVDPTLDERTKYSGVLRFRQHEPNPLFFIRFDKRIRNRRVKREKQWHVFDGRWYLDARERTKQINKQEIVRAGERLEVFRIGKGPFPLPFGQKKADIVRECTVKLVPVGKEAPPKFKGDHLELTPRPNTEMDRPD